MRCVYLMPSIPWPVQGGREISAHYVLRALVERGHEVHVLVERQPTPTELAAWPLATRLHVEAIEPTATDAPTRAGGLRNRWLQYWGTNPALPAAVARAVTRINPDYVEAAGLEVLPWVMDIERSVPRLWLAADDPCLYQLSLLARRSGIGQRLATLTNAAQFAAYERMFASMYDAAVVASPVDRRAMKLFAGFRHVEVVRNAVDHDFFAPAPASITPTPDSVIFWGRLDFQPNIDAIMWFGKEVWPTVRRRHRLATWRILGRNATPEVIDLAAETRGVELLGGVADLRPYVYESSVSIMPMLNGTGIKNKLLEAASMARPIVATPTATNGLAWEEPRPWRSAATAEEWADALSVLWGAAEERRRLSKRAREWVTTHHHWRVAAEFRESFSAQRNAGRASSLRFVAPAVRRAA